MTQVQRSTKDFFQSESVQSKFKELLGKRSVQFVTSVLQVVNSSELLSKADPISIYNAAVLAATLDLPINSNLGFAYIIPYNTKDGCKAQFQLGYKGFIQLAMRSGQFNRISSAPIYEGQIKSANPLTGYEFDFTQKTSDKIIGYASYFRLVNGFEATWYMSTEQLVAHGKKYSQSFKRGYGLWKDDFEAMANKTVLKLLLSKFAPLSVETQGLQQAIVSDQAIINTDDAQDVTYVDNTPPEINHGAERLESVIAACDSVDQLDAVFFNLTSDLQDFAFDLYESRKEQLLNAAK